MLLDGSLNCEANTIIPTEPVLGLLHNPPKFPPSICLVSQEQSDACAREFDIVDELRPGELCVKDPEYPYFCYTTHGRAYSSYRVVKQKKKMKKKFYLSPEFTTQDMDIVSVQFGIDADAKMFVILERNLIVDRPVNPRWISLKGSHPYFNRSWPEGAIAFHRAAAPLLLKNDNPTENTMVFHIDRDFRNNRLENWCWISKAQNIAYVQLANELIYKKATRYFNVTYYGTSTSGQTTWKIQLSLGHKQIQIGTRARSDYEAAMKADDIIREYLKKNNLPLRQLLNFPSPSEIKELANWLHIEIANV